MNNVPDTELFSAYLDGELTADEQVRVEQVLATSPEARQLLEELRALSVTLQNLPEQKLGEDLSARVLELAQRRTADVAGKPAAGRAAESLQATEETGDAPRSFWREISLRGMLSRRAVIWSGVVLATGIIISLTTPPPKPDRNVARQDAVAVEEVRSKPASAGSWDAPAGATTTPRGEVLRGVDGQKPTDRKTHETELSHDDMLRKAAEPKVAKADGETGGAGSVVGGAAGAPAPVQPPKASVASKTQSDLPDASQIAKADAAAPDHPASKAKAEAGELGKKTDVVSAEVEKAPASGHLATDASTTRKLGDAKDATTVNGRTLTPNADLTKKSEDAKNRLAMRDGSGLGGRFDPTGEKAAEDDQAERDKAVGDRFGGPHKFAGKKAAEKAMPAVDAIAESKPVPEPVAPATPAPASAPAPSKPKADDIARSANKELAESPATDAAAAKTQETQKPGEAAGMVRSKRGPGKHAAKGGLNDEEQVAEDRDLKRKEQLLLMNGTFFQGNAAAQTASNSKSGAGLSANRPAGPATVIRLEVSATAMQNKVFENVLLRSGLGGDANGQNDAVNVPANNRNSYGVSNEAGRGGGVGLNRQQVAETDNSGQGEGMPRRSGSASLGSTKQQYESPDAKPAAESQEETTQALQQQAGLSKAVVYELDVSPEQLAVIVKQLGERGESFSPPEIDQSAPGLNTWNFSGQNSYNNDRNNSLGAYSGGTSATNQTGAQQNKGDDGKANQVREQAAQSQPAPTQAARPAVAAGGKQHVVFVLSVVDRLPARAQSAVPMPAAAPPASPAKK